MNQFFYNIADTTCAQKKHFVIIVSNLTGNRDLPENYDLKTMQKRPANI